MKSLLKKYLSTLFAIIFILNLSVTVNAANALTIIKHPINTSCFSGEKISVSVSAKGDGLKYQWWVKNTSNSKFNKSSIKTKNYVTVMNPTRDGRKLYCVITDKYGNKKVSKTVTLSIKKEILIVKQPVSVKLYEGEKAKISFIAKGEELKYQWWVKNPNTKNFYKSSIKTGEYVTSMKSTRDGRALYCVVTDKFGNKKVSDTVTITMKRPAVITKQPKSTSYGKGDKVNVLVDANGDGLKYQWWVKNTNNGKFYKSSIKTNKYVTVMDSTKNARKLYCEVTDKYGNAVFSEIITLSLLKKVPCKVHTFGKETPVCYNDGKYKFEKLCKNCATINSVYYDAIISFVDDDAKADALYSWERIMDATGIKMTSAVISSKVTEKTEYKGYSSYAGWDDILRLKEKGMDFVNHTFGHKNLTKLSADQMRNDFETSKKVLGNKGINSDILVYPNTAYNDTVLEVVPEFFKSAVACKGKINKAPFENLYTLNRVNLNTSKVTKDITFGKETVTCHGIRPIGELKKYASDAQRSKGWLVFMTHAYNSPSGKTYFDSDAEKTIIDFCNYIKESGNIRIITLTEGVEITSAYK